MRLNSDETKATNLRQLLRYHENDLKLVSCSTDDWLTQLEDRGIPPRYVDNLDHAATSRYPNTAYAKLPRPGSIPGKLNVVFEGHDLQQVLEKLWTGDCLFLVKQTQGSNSTTHGGLFLDFLDFELEAVAARGNELFSVTFCGGIVCGRIRVKSSISPPLGLNLAIDQLQRLAYRVLHIFLRQYAFALEPLMLNGLFGQLAEIYKSKRFLRENLDLSILSADLALNLVSPRGHPRAALEELIKVGGALEALGQFEEAASIYLETAQLCKPGMLHQFKAYEMAAVALTRAEKYQGALEFYAQALKAFGVYNRGIWDFTEEYFVELMSGVLMLFYTDHICRMNFKEPKTGEAIVFTSHDKMYPALTGLLLVVGFQPSNSDAAEHLSKANSGGCIVILKAKFKVPKTAKRTLIQIFHSGSAATYQEKLFSTLNNHMDAGLREHLGAEWVGQAIKSQKQSRRDAQKVVKQRRAMGGKLPLMCSFCKVPEPEESKFLFCPCHLVCYCSTMCQKNDWVQHKKACRWFA